MVSSPNEHPKKFIVANGKRMAYVEVGEGPPIIFLHGNPTSSYLWRNVIPHLTASGRCLAPDLIGMGDSEKLDNPNQDSYRYIDHREFLDELFNVLGLNADLVLVMHDWGSALGFDWARRHPDAIKGLVYMEAIVRPLTWKDWNDDARPIFEAFRSPSGEKMILENNIFVERVLPGSILRILADEEMDNYRRPYLNEGEDRRPTLTWPRQIPIDGKPKDVNQIVADYASWMAENDLPKLFINADPGAILIGSQREFCRTWKNQTEVTVGGSHFLQEDAPDEIGSAIASWLDKLF